MDGLIWSSLRRGSADRRGAYGVGGDAFVGVSVTVGLGAGLGGAGLGW
jgi:hypothetical protein